MASFIVKQEEGIEKFDNCIMLGADQFKSLSSLKIKILEILDKTPMFISEISKKLNLNEQNIYYHMRDLLPLLEVVEEKKIRGVIAKKYKPKSMNFCLSLSDNFKDYKTKSNNRESIHEFFKEFLTNNIFNAKIVVGSPDPHGSYKARARDGHYAIDLALYLGNYCRISKDFSVSLDVDVKLKEIKQNIIIVGGPVTNLLMGEMNEHLSVKFIEEKQWAIKGKNDIYSDDNMGVIAKVPHPFADGKWIITIAGIRFSGTKAAVIGLTRFTKLALNRYTGQKEFCAVIQGFDLDGDGKLDSIELLE